MHYNFARIHQTTRVTPAMAAGVSDKLWDVTDVVRVIEAHENGEVPQTALTPDEIRHSASPKANYPAVREPR